MLQDDSKEFIHVEEKRWNETSSAETLRYLWDPRLDPLFWQMSRTGVASAWFEHIPFAHWLVQVASPRILVELGTHAGVSYSAFCESVLRSNLPTQCFAVDTWKGDEHALYYGEEVFLDFERFHSARYGSFSELLRCTFDEALSHFAEHSVDLLHVDGYHTYEAVRHDFESWYGKLSERAIVLFHDTNTRERDFGVWRYFAELKAKYPSFEFTHGHGLGMLAVGPHAPTEILALCKLDDLQKISAVRNRFARIGERWSALWRAEGAEAHARGLEKARSDQERHISDQEQHIKKIRYQAQEREDEAARRIADRQAQLVDLEQRLHQSQEREASAARQVADLKHDLAMFKKAAENSRKEYIKAVSSTSWRITAPLRTVNSHLKEARRVKADAPTLEASSLALEASSFFQAEWYRQKYSDIQAANVNPALHYLTDGWREGRDPSPLFSTSWYLEKYQDVRQVDTNPLLHFIRHGLHESRMPSREVMTAPWLESNRPEILAYLAGLGKKTSWASTAAESPEVSIIILNLNKAFLTIQCLISLWTHTVGARYEVIVVDNGSTLDEREILSGLKGPFRIVQLNSNRYFGEANNIGAEAARGSILVFMNNDVVVTPGWLLPLVRTLRERPACGAAGPKFVFPDGRLQEAGAYLEEDGVAVQRGNKQDPADPSFAEECVVDYVSAATVAIRTDDFMKVGGFDYRWEPAYYEDADLCLKLRSLDLKTYYQPQSTVIHYQSATTTDVSHQLQLHNIVAINRTKLLERWGPYLARRETAAMPQILYEPPRAISQNGADNRPRAAFFTPYNIIPGGGERYLLTIAEALSETHSITLVTPERVSRLRIATVTRELGVELSNIRLVTLQDVQKESFDLWVAMGNAIVPPARAHGALSIYMLQFPFPLASQPLDEGRRWWKEYKLVVVNSKYTRDHVVENVRRYAFAPQNVKIISPPVIINGHDTEVAKLRGSILSVGRFFAGGHCKNQHVMIKAFRRMVEESDRSELELHLAGSLHPEAEHREFFEHCEELAAGLPVFFHLDTSFKELQALFDRSSIYWHAAGLGSNLAAHPERAEHFGITVVEAMAAGCIPVVYGHGGPAEIVEDGVSGLIYSDIDQLVTITKKVVAEWTPSQVENMRTAARARAMSYDVEHFRSAWRDTVTQSVA